MLRKIFYITFKENSKIVLQEMPFYSVIDSFYSIHSSTTLKNTGWSQPHS